MDRIPLVCNEGLMVLSLQLCFNLMIFSNFDDYFTMQYRYKRLTTIPFPILGTSCYERGGWEDFAL